MMVPTFAAPAPSIQVQARNAVLIDATYDEILYDKGAYEKAYPASITKVMTALLVIEAIERGELSENQMITCSETAPAGLSIYGSTQNIKPGETLSVRDLLYCLMLPSANEAANILAEAVSGDIERFVDLMNQRAQELGCEYTHFKNAHGLHDDNHYTTAYDIYLFFKKAMEYDLFREIVYTSVYETAPTELAAARKFFNSNALVSQWRYKGYLYTNCLGGKTGSTPEAGNCLVTAAADGDKYYIAVVLGAEVINNSDGTVDRMQFTESRRLYRWGFDTFERKQLVLGAAPIASIPVTLSSDADEVLLRPSGTIERTLPRSLNIEDFQTEVTLFSETLQAPVSAGEVMGKITLTYDGEVYGTLDLITLSDIERSNFLYYREQVLQFFRSRGLQLAVGVVLVLSIGVFLRIFVFRKPRTYAGVGSGRSSGSRSVGRGGRRGR